MMRKIALALVCCCLLSTSLLAQNRDFRREREELDRAERAEKRRLKREGYMGRPKVDYGSNILRLSPITAMDIGVGFGLSYERIFGQEQMIGIVIPAALILQDKADGYNPINGTYNNDVRYNAYFYFTPGLKIYPFGQRRVTYAVGPSLMFMYGGGKEWVSDYDSNTGVTTFRESEMTRTRFGMLVNNYVNFQITPAFNLGLELGLGMRYYDKESRTNTFYNYGGSYNNGFDVTGQFSMTLGYRF
ncbi:hypothetical protein [Taibaiella chishuiensis]|uniref:Outer membrane protein with beta-barrel domain n=1 Tax=Taibaiella chishuiensis TaxID=1434707 RepID=A0A2P8DBI0_9BACT|nr:hypothetical protein [Taibaiella chishuiensis]PSK94581.1 hypothetical protein B0I18_101737 [Taibaiella chishuiensis]